MDLFVVDAGPLGVMNVDLWVSRESLPAWITILVYVLDLVLRIGLAIRVVMRRRPVGVSLAWLMVVLIFPFVGAFVYLALGELRLGNRRARWATEIHELYDEWLVDLRKRSDVDWSALGPECEPLSQLAAEAAGIPALPGNKYQLLDDWEHVFPAIIADIDAAERTCHLEFYIWNLGGSADEVAEALIRAADREVICRVLVDALGSRKFLRSSLAKRMRQHGIQVRAALSGNILRSPFVRFDLRLHRKIVVIDGEIGYTGSLNMVDPRHFKQGAGVGQWVDAMVRVEGSVVEPLAITFLEDWQIETSEGLDSLRQTGDARVLEARGDTAMQVIPSGPAMRNEAIQQILLMTIYAARRELILTTPYFVPEESLLTALISAARRGVDVTLIVPAKNDSKMVRFASQAFKGDLIAAGVRVAQFTEGLLHTKSISVDGEFSLFGSLNLDPRSLHLNFEITLGVYDREFTAELRALQQSYVDHSEFMDLDEWRRRSFLTKFLENVARLLGPLL